MGGKDEGAWGSVYAWAEKARKAVEEATAEPKGYDQVSAADLELGEDSAPQWANWALGAADRARRNLASAADKAATQDWGGQAKAWTGDLSSTLGKVSESAAKAGAGLGAGFGEQAKMAQQKAALAASAARTGLEKAGSGLGSVGALAMSPTLLIQFAGIFMLGLMLVSLSLSFLPLLPIQPQKFALLFSLGSMTMLGSVAFLKGPAAFLGAMAQRDKIPFSVAYGVGLLGSFWATLIARSYLFTAIFVFAQVVGLLYFLASFVPGGKALLNFFGRIFNRGARAAVGK